MFQDITSSEDLTKQFTEAQKSLPIEVEFFILSEGSWPIKNQNVIVRLPQ